MIGTIKTVDVHAFCGLTLTKVELAEYLIKLHFDDQHRIDVEEYWEYLDADGKLIDRAMSAKFRKEFYLGKLVDHKLAACEKVLSSVVLVFDNNERLPIFIQDRIQDGDLLTMISKNAPTYRIY